MDGVRTLSISLPITDWTSIIGALWSAALIQPERLEDDDRLGSLLYGQYATAFGFTGDEVANGLTGLPAAIRQQVRDLLPASGGTDGSDRHEATHA